MKMDLVLELMDVPGQLVSVLDPISGLGANLVTVIHKRDSKNEKGMIPVQLTLEGERDSLDRVIERFKELGVSIIAMDGVVKKEVVSTILIGHIVDNDIRDTMDKINSLDGVYVVGFDIKLDGESKSSALINIETDFGMKEFIFDKYSEVLADNVVKMFKCTDKSKYMVFSGSDDKRHAPFDIGKCLGVNVIDIDCALYNDEYSLNKFVSTNYLYNKISDNPFSLVNSEIFKKVSENRC